MLKFPCNHCCLSQYYEFKNIIDSFNRKDEIIIFNCCFIIIHLLFYKYNLV